MKIASLRSAGGASAFSELGKKEHAEKEVSPLRRRPSNAQRRKIAPLFR